MQRLFSPLLGPLKEGFLYTSAVLADHVLQSEVSLKGRRPSLPQHCPNLSLPPTHQKGACTVSQEVDLLPEPPGSSWRAEKEKLKREREEWLGLKEGGAKEDWRWINRCQTIETFCNEPGAAWEPFPISSWTCVPATSSGGMPGTALCTAPSWNTPLPQAWPDTSRAQPDVHSLIDFIFI